MKLQREKSEDSVKKKRYRSNYEPNTKIQQGARKPLQTPQLGTTAKALTAQVSLKGLKLTQGPLELLLSSRGQPAANFSPALAFIYDLRCST